METVQAKTTTHPLFIAAAGSIIIFSALGSAAIMGWLPRGSAESGANLSAAPAASVATGPVTSAPTTAHAVTPVAAKPAAAPVPRVIARAEPRPVRRAEPQHRVVESSHPVFAEPQAVHSPDTRRSESEHLILADARESAPPFPPRSLPPVCRDCGVIESVNEIEKDGEGSGLGAVAGGVVGAVAGKQVDGGRGRTVMSVLGAVGGAYAGHQIEKNARKVKSYDVTIRFDDGSTRTLSQSTPPAWRAGDRVRLVNGIIQPNA